MGNKMLRKSKYIVRIDNLHFDGSEEVTCLGNQLVKILSCLSPILEGLDWYLFDIKGSSEKKITDLFPKKSSQAYSKFESVRSLINSIHEVHQFEKGVFIGIPKNLTVKWDDTLLPDTEEELYMQNPLAKIEIRTFDFSYFEIYIDSDELINQLKSCFNISQDNFV